VNGPIRELPRTDLPNALSIAAGVACGVLAAVAALIVLSRAGVELAGVWRDLLAAKGLQLRAAGAWWLMAASAFLAGAAVTGALSRLPLPWHRFRLLRWIAGAALVFGLAHVGHSASLESGASVAIHTVATFAALCAAILMALFGAYFALKR
jgi:hypothetical protein